MSELISLKMLNVEPHRAVDEATVEGLVRSIGEVGLLQPIVVDDQLNVIAGVHRVHAARRMGWMSIPAVEVKLDALHAELATIDENLVRNEGTALERAEQLKRRKEIYEEFHPETKHGGDHGNQHTGGKAAEANGNDCHLPPFAEDVAQKTGISDRTVRQYVKVAKDLAPEAKRVIEKSPIADSITDMEQLSRLPAEKQVEVAKRAVETGETVKRAAKSLKRAEQLEQVKAYVPPEGEYALIVRDPAWPYEDELDGSDAARGGTPYPTTPVEEICKQKIPAAKDCVLFLWVTNAHVIDGSAAKVLEAWGFTGKTMATWPKPKMGNGHWIRGQTEHVILATKGKPKVDLKNQTTLLPMWKPGKRPPGVDPHSAKPDEFFPWAAKLVPVPEEARLEMDSRTPRKGWVVSGAELPRCVGHDEIEGSCAFTGRVSKKGRCPSCTTRQAYIEQREKHGHPKRSKAPVGKPLAWEELQAKATELGWTVRNVTTMKDTYVLAKCARCRDTIKIDNHRRGVDPKYVAQMKEHEHLGKQTCVGFPVGSCDREGTALCYDCAQKESRAYRHSALKVDCPDCPSQKGALCNTGSGVVRVKPHQARKNAAERAKNGKRQ